MKNYRVILHNKQRNQVESSDRAGLDTWICGVVGSKIEPQRVRLARLAPCTSGLEISWVKSLGLGIAVAGLVGGSMSGEAQASVANRLELPQAERVVAATSAPLSDWGERDLSEESLQVLVVPGERERRHGLLADVGDHTDDIDADKSVHVNTQGDHVDENETIPGEADWNNHHNVEAGHSNNNWSNHLNGFRKNTQFQHINSLPGDYIF